MREREGRKGSGGGRGVVRVCESLRLVPPLLPCPQKQDEGPVYTELQRSENEKGIICED